jgi:hypothetical protein
MKKLIMVLGMAVALIGGVVGCSNTVMNEGAEGTVPQAEIDSLMAEVRASSTGSKWAVEKEEVVESNVGDGQEYAYTITAIIDDEVYGIPLNKESYTNKGIFLYQSEIGFEVGEGDNIIVVWGEEEDIFQSIERAIITEDGSIVPESFYN